jgi:hypothetical protein
MATTSVKDDERIECFWSLGLVSAARARNFNARLLFFTCVQQCATLRLRPPDWVVVQACQVRLKADTTDAARHRSPKTRR